MVAGEALLLLLQPSSPYWAIVFPATCIGGFGGMLAYQSGMIAGLGHVDDADEGTASAALSFALATRASVSASRSARPRRSCVAASCCARESRRTRRWPAACTPHFGSVSRWDLRRCLRCSAYGTPAPPKFRCGTICRSASSHHPAAVVVRARSGFAGVLEPSRRALRSGGVRRAAATRFRPPLPRAARADAWTARWSYASAAPPASRRRQWRSSGSKSSPPVCPP